MSSDHQSGTVVRFIDPAPPSLVDAEQDGETKSAFSIAVSGMGQLVGLSYRVPPHSIGKIKANLQISALSSDDVKALNDLAMSMLNASYREQVKTYAETSASASLSLWTWFFGGSAAKADFKYTSDIMKSKGLTEDQITLLMEAFLDRAKRMSSVEIEFTTNNSANDYGVEGDLYLYTIQGTIKTEKGVSEYRMLAERASAGGPPPSGGGAPSTGEVTRLN